MDSICHLMCSNKFKSTTLSVPSPFMQNQIIDLHVQSNGTNKTQVSIINGPPYINIEVNLKASVESSEFGLDLSNNENLQLIGDSASSFIKNNILDYLYKTSKDLHSDICRVWESISY
ncbi:MAG: Ger(x)C family spore germination C-terminal domain-containing protein [Clostridia bacterium]|nr:Ger(x)C family spore germination C-terminal domain-containing protein [Clostridia bacterium]